MEERKNRNFSRRPKQDRRADRTDPETAENLLEGRNALTEALAAGRSVAVTSTVTSSGAETVTSTAISRTAARSARISSSRSVHRQSLSQPILMTMSISSAPLRMASSVSNTLTSVVE